MRTLNVITNTPMLLWLVCCCCVVHPAWGIEKRFSISTAPEDLSLASFPNPPSNLRVQVENGTAATVRWQPPAIGPHSGFKLALIPLSEPENKTRNIVISTIWYNASLSDLSRDASYEIRLYTIDGATESQAYASTKFTTATQPNTPGSFVVWFRNETTLLVLWQPPYPAGIFDGYKVSIDPEDANLSEVYVPKEAEPPGPAQVAFNGLVPGRSYNLSVRTVSENRTSEPSTALYRTAPLRPENVTFDPEKIGPYSFTVRWSAPSDFSEFEMYKVKTSQSNSQTIIKRGQPLEATFNDDVQPGRTYQVVVKTFSGNVSSWPEAVDVTTRPLAVRELRQETIKETGEIRLAWDPNPESHQDSYKIKYEELGTIKGDSSSLVVEDPFFSLENLKAGRNYSISVRALSNSIESLAIQGFGSSVQMYSYQTGDGLRPVLNIEKETIDPPPPILSPPASFLPKDFILGQAPASLLPEDLQIDQEELPALLLPKEFILALREAAKKLLF